jgi:hypothetical protein
MGDVEQAEDTIIQAIDRMEAEHLRLLLVDALRVKALVLIKQNHLDAAGQTLAEGVTLARSLPYPHGEGRLLQVHGLLHYRKGEQAQARERLDAALTIFRRLGARKDLEWAERDLAALASGAASSNSAS